MLNELQRDLLAELVNVYVGEAASMLSEMVNQKVFLTVPQVELISISDIDRSDERHHIFFSEGHLITTSLQFGHEFNGKAFLMLPADQAAKLVSICYGEVNLPDMAGNPSLTDTDLDALREISNVILNAIIGEFGNFLSLKLEYSLSDVELIHVSSAGNPVFLQNEVYVLILHTSFKLADSNVNGVILIALSMASISNLLGKVDALLEDANG